MTINTADRYRYVDYEIYLNFLTYAMPSAPPLCQTDLHPWALLPTPYQRYRGENVPRCKCERVLPSPFELLPLPPRPHIRIPNHRLRCLEKRE